MPIARRFAFLALPLLLAACQSSQPQPPSMASGMTRDGFFTAKPLTPAEEEKALAAADRVQAMAPAQMAASTLGGLDPTGLSQNAVQAETMRRYGELEKYLPGMMASNLERAAGYCRANPATQDCDMVMEHYRKTKAAQGKAAP
ncbi:hypothetical protein NGM99_06300 [Mesorhizobium sp. RP14(2022)]|uniref:Uncharacterized protein n=1 Tax=Mesorhizobium liriopis TaxID=2953882 RepID=A0ABT1C3J0_9HYPH|nr:hypothetical protein [Mesorhizobium liriopis]MCO6049399.1 hypothetical protein [Mesorhizobium liriopis]